MQGKTTPTDGVILQPGSPRRVSLIDDDTSAEDVVAITIGGSEVAALGEVLLHDTRALAQAWGNNPPYHWRELPEEGVFDLELQPALDAIEALQAAHRTQTSITVKIGRARLHQLLKSGVDDQCDILSEAFAHPDEEGMIEGFEWARRHLMAYIAMLDIAGLDPDETDVPKGLRHIAEVLS